jgi:hypothetical protein
MSKSKARSKWANAKKGRAASYSGPFVGHMVEMLEAPAYMVLSLSARRVLDRLEVELLDHGGNDNGRLTVTFSQFVDYNVRRNSVGAAIREVIALGFAEITERGCAGNAGYGKANKYRLTYRPAEGVPDDGSHEWRRIKTMEDALSIQKQAHEPPPMNVLKRGGNGVQNHKPTPHIDTNSPPTSGGERPQFPPPTSGGTI